MTLDEAIKHAEEVAEENQRVVDTGIIFDDVTIDMLYCDDTEVIEEHLENYQRCAEEHKQLAEWLKELKKLKEQEPVLDKIRAEIAGIPKKYPMTMDYENGLKEALGIIDKYKAESEEQIMAEYVTKEQAIHSVTETELNQGGFPDVKMRISEIPPADVIERSKVDNAIKEINLESNVCAGMILSTDIYNHCIEIIKRNIGE